MVAIGRSVSGRTDEAVQFGRASLYVSVAGIIIGCLVIAVVVAMNHSSKTSTTTTVSVAPAATTVTVVKSCSHGSNHYTMNQQCYCRSYAGGAFQNQSCIRCC